MSPARPRPWGRTTPGPNAGHGLLWTLPSLCTLLNLLCGFTCVLYAAQGRSAEGAVFIAAAVVLDIADGALARLTGHVTPFGLQFDSLADVVSFGVAPAVLSFVWLPARLYPLGWLVGFLWLAAAATRLARFTATVDPRADKRFFAGLPSPGAAAVVAATVYALDPPPHTVWPVLAVLVFVAAALLMISTVPYRSFRSLVSPPGRPWPLVLVTVGVVLGALLVPVPTACALAYGYLVHPLVLRAST